MNARTAIAALLALALAAAGGDDFSAGVAAYRDGRFADALASFAAADRAAGDAASAELLVDLSLAALRAGDVDAAARAADRAAARGGPRFEEIAAFLRGNVSFARAERAAAIANQPEAEPFAFDSALAHARAAEDSWRRAALSRGDWPEAVRNVERARAQVAAIERAKAEAEKKRAANRKTREAQPDPKRKPASAPNTTPETVKPAQQADDDGGDVLRRVLARLDRNERAKRELRKAERRVHAAEVERDW